MKGGLVAGPPTLALLALGLLLGCGEGFEGGESTGGGGSGTGGGTGGGGVVLAAGCADDSRERYDDLSAFPDIAGCQGAWTVPGVTTEGSQSPNCLREAGNEGDNPTGDSCSVADLCASGWHVCASDSEVADKSGGAGCPTTVAGEFWLTRQTTDAGNVTCGSGSENNLVGCGQLGQPADPSCSPLDAVVFFSHCDTTGGVWSCGSNAEGDREAALVVKTSVLEPGGVLCCRD